MNDIEIDVYLVGVDKEEAKRKLIHADWDSAYDYHRDNPGSKIYIATAFVDFLTMEECEE